MKEEQNTQGTPFVDIFKIFMNSITSDKFASLLTPQQLQDTLVDYLFKSSDLYFTQCLKDLSKRSDTHFDVKLDNDEQQILASGMRLAWLQSNHIANERNLYSRLLTKDYHIYSPANQLKVLNDLQAEYQTRLRRDIVAYQYRHWMAE